MRSARRILTNVDSSLSSLSNSASLSAADARRILSLGHQRHIQSNLERFTTALGASGPSRLAVHFTPSLLSSASLVASHVKHRILRGLEHMGTVAIRRTLDMVGEKCGLWEHKSSQEGRRLQCQQVEQHLKLREAALKTKLVFEENNEAIKGELEEIRDCLRKLEISQKNMEATVEGNFHPSTLLKGDRVFLTPTEVAQLPSPLATIRGMLIQIKGPRRGNRGMTWRKSIGRISTNSVKYVVAEESKIQVPSKLGVFGLTVRIVYARTNRLVDPRGNLNILDNPKFKFLVN